MRARVPVAVIAAVVLGGSVLGQSGKHLNPMVDLLAAKKPIFGLWRPRRAAAGPAAIAGARADGTAARRAATPAPPPAPPKTPLELAKDALAHPESDFFFNGGMERGVDRGIAAFTEYANALVDAGAIAGRRSATPCPLSVKTPKISPDPAKAIENISRQLNVGVSVDRRSSTSRAPRKARSRASPRCASSRRAARARTTIGNAPKYWGLTREGVPRQGGRVAAQSRTASSSTWTIVESKEGLANVREIAR